MTKLNSKLFSGITLWLVAIGGPFMGGNLRTTNERFQSKRPLRILFGFKRSVVVVVAVVVSAGFSLMRSSTHCQAKQSEQVGTKFRTVEQPLNGWMNWAASLAYDFLRSTITQFPAKSQLPLSRRSLT